MRRALKTTTAIMASFVLVAPSVLPAQQTGSEVFPCPEGTAQEVCDQAEALKKSLGGLTGEVSGQDAEQNSGQSQSTGAETTGAEPAPEAEAKPDDAPVSQQTGADAEAEAAAQAEKDAKAEADAQADIDAKAEAAAQADEAAKAEAAAQADEAAKAEAAAQADEAAKAEAAAQADEAAKAETAAQADEAAKAEAAAQADEAAKAEAAAQADEAAKAEAAAQADVDAKAEAAAQADKDAEAKAAAKIEADARKEAEKADEPAENTEKATEKAEEQNSTDSAEQTAPPAAPRDNLDEAAEAQLPVVSEAATADADSDAEVETTSETVTEDTARRSDQDFEGTIKTEAGGETAKAEEKSGLSKFEKALLLGAGALVVGAIVKGNRKVESTSGDRVVVSGSDGRLEVLKDDDALLRQPGNDIETQTFSDGSTRSVVTRADGSKIVTIRDAELRVLRRTLVRADGNEFALIDDTEKATPVDVSTLPQPAKAITTDGDEAALRTALAATGAFERHFSLAQIRQIKQVRALAPAIEVDSITFATGSAAIRPEQAQKLARLGVAIQRMVADNPQEVFLVEGHTDAVGSASTNLLLSDRRAESLALALTEYFDVPPENLVVQGYGESDLKVSTDTAEQANRRADLRRITGLLQVASLR